MVDVVGGEPRNLTADVDLSASGVRWSSDGSEILFTVANGLSSHLYKMSAGGGEPEMILPDDDYIYGGTTLSDDGSKLIFTGSSPYTTRPAARGSTPRPRSCRSPICRGRWPRATPEV